MEDLFYIPQGDRCATNQVIYNLSDCGIERDLLPWCARHGVSVMAYSPRNVIAIEHVEENAVVLSLTLTPQELQALKLPWAGGP